MKMQIATTVLSLIVAAITTAAPVKYQVKGQLPDRFNGTKVVIYSIDLARTPLDSAIVANGTFSMSGSKPQPCIARITARTGQEEHTAILVLEDGDTKVTFADGKLLVDGGMRTQAMQRYTEIQKTMSGMSREESEALGKEYRDSATTDTRRKEIMEIVQKAREPYMNAARQFMRDNKDNIVGAFYYQHLAPLLDEKEADDILFNGSEEFKSHSTIQSLLKMREAAKKREIGRQYTDFEMADTNGKMHKLSEYIGNGKYVMIDFWASWCGPCRAEMPNVKAAYAKYHDKGFDIVGVSLDSKRDAWLKAIEQLEMPWHQLSDLKGWECAASTLYGVGGIPCTLLIGPDGKIVASDLRGEELDKKLDELLK